MLKYPCLVLDHDDTVVASESNINYPFFCYILQNFRPGAAITLDEYTQDCFTIGFSEMCRRRFRFNEEELVSEYQQWLAYIRTHIPRPIRASGKSCISSVPWGAKSAWCPIPAPRTSRETTGSTSIWSRTTFSAGTCRRPSVSPPLSPGNHSGKIFFPSGGASGGGRYAARLRNGPRLQGPHCLFRVEPEGLPGNFQSDEGPLRFFL